MNKLAKILKIVVDIIVYFLIAVVGLYLILSLYSKYIKKDEIFSIGKYYIFQIITGSMEYELRIGDYIIIEKSDKYEVGDIVTYKEDDYYITHRINKIDESGIITKGDANSSLDKPISENKIVGKYLFKAKILTFLMRYKVLIISIIIAIIILESAFSNKKGNNKEESKKEEILIIE